MDPGPRRQRHDPWPPGAGRSRQNGALQQHDLEEDERMSNQPPQQPGAPAGAWHPDPYHRHELRYHDGVNWTQHVSSHGVTQVDPVQQQAGAIQSISNVLDQPIGQMNQAQVQSQVAGAVGYQGGPVAQGGGSLFTEPILVVNQKAKIIEVNNEYAIFNQAGQQIGGVTQVGQSAAKKALRMLGSYDQFMTHKLVVHDLMGAPLLQLTRPAKVFKSTVVVENPGGQEIGQIKQENMIGKIRFGLLAGGHQYGSINAENWRAWNFSIQDHTGREIARITKTWEGLAKMMFTTADNYVVQIHDMNIQDPLHSLVIAAAVSVDTALKQDSRGLG